MLRKSFIGSYNYVAPEVFFKGDLSFKGDIFSFGDICFYLFHQSIDNSSIQLEIKSKYFKNNFENWNFDEIQNLFKFKDDLRTIKICHKCKYCEICDLKNTYALCESCKNCQPQCITIESKIYYKLQATLFNELLSRKKIQEEEQSQKPSNGKKNKVCSGIKKNINNELNIPMNENVRKMMLECLQNTDKRPDINKLVLDTNTVAVFKDLYNLNDFPGINDKK